MSTKTPPAALSKIPKTWWSNDEKNWDLIETLYRRAKGSDYFMSITRFLEAKGHLTKAQQTVVLSGKVKGRPPVPNKFCHEKKPVTAGGFTFSPITTPTPPPVSPPVTPPTASASSPAVAEIREKFEALKTGISATTAVPGKATTAGTAIPTVPPPPPPKPVNPYEVLRKMLLTQRGYASGAVLEEPKEKSEV